jgi:hypothetical protein
MQESWEEWRREGKLAKSTMEVSEAQFVAGSRRKKGYLYTPPSKNLTVAVPRAEYPGQVGAEYLPPGFSGKKSAQKSAPITGSEPPEI